jgi:hypothetical protein
MNIRDLKIVVDGELITFRHFVEHYDDFLTPVEIIEVLENLESEGVHHFRHLLSGNIITISLPLSVALSKPLVAV